MAPKPRIVSSKVSYRGNTIAVLEESVRLADTTTSWREVVRFTDSAQVLVVDEKEKLLLTREYRTGLDATVLKIPGGKVRSGERPIRAAAREFEEEIGLRPIGLKPLFAARGGEALRWNRYFFYAGGLKPGTAQPDQGERITIVRLPLKQAVSLAWRGDFYNGEIAYAVLRFAKLKRVL